MMFHKIFRQNFSEGSGYRIPAGAYWVGDLSTVLFESWENFLETRHDEEATAFCGEHEGMFAAALATSYGDGVFEDETKRTYTTDSGLIGVIDTSLFEDEPDNGHYFTFDDDFEFSINNEGLVNIAEEVFINTANIIA